MIRSAEFAMIAWKARNRMMSLTSEAIYENGVLRLLAPLALRENQRVTVTVSETDSEDLLDQDYLQACRSAANDSIKLETVQVALAKIPDSLTADFIAERKDR
jgi:predicted DNA-binding antitoxin AbrB/MazE fold protein